MQTTASHNPSGYNGFKLSRRDAIPVSNETGIAHIEELVKGRTAPDPEPQAAITHADVSAAYRQHVLSFRREAIQEAPWA